MSHDSSEYRKTRFDRDSAGTAIDCRDFMRQAALLSFWLALRG